MSTTDRKLTGNQGLSWRESRQSLTGDFFAPPAPGSNKTVRHTQIIGRPGHQAWDTQSQTSNDDFRTSDAFLTDQADVRKRRRRLCRVLVPIVLLVVLIIAVCSLYPLLINRDSGVTLGEVTVSMRVMNWQYDEQMSDQRSSLFRVYQGGLCQYTKTALSFGGFLDEYHRCNIVAMMNGSVYVTYNVIIKNAEKTHDVENCLRQSLMTHEMNGMDTFTLVQADPETLTFHVDTIYEPEGVADDDAANLRLSADILSSLIINQGDPNPPPLPNSDRPRPEAQPEEELLPLKNGSMGSTYLLPQLQILTGPMPFPDGTDIQIHNIEMLLVLNDTFVPQLSDLQSPEAQELIHGLCRKIQQAEFRSTLESGESIMRQCVGRSIGPGSIYVELMIDYFGNIGTLHIPYEDAMTVQEVLLLLEPTLIELSSIQGISLEIFFSETTPVPISGNSCEIGDCGENAFCYVFEDEIHCRCRDGYEVDATQACVTPVAVLFDYSAHTQWPVDMAERPSGLMDAAIGPFNIVPPLPFANEYWVNMNGLISFWGANAAGCFALDGGSPDFPRVNGVPIVAPLWIDYDISASDDSYVYFSSVSDDLTFGAIKARVCQFLDEEVDSCTFSPEAAIIVTFVDVTYTSGGPTNTIQGAVASDGTDTYVIFNYETVGFITTTTTCMNSQMTGWDLGSAGTDYEILNDDLLTTEAEREAAIETLLQGTNLNFPGSYVYKLPSLQDEPTPEVNPAMLDYSSDPSERLIPGLPLEYALTNSIYVGGVEIDKINIYAEGYVAREELDLTCVTEEPLDVTSQFAVFAFLTNLNPVSSSGGVYFREATTDDLNALRPHVCALLEEDSCMIALNSGMIITYSRVTFRPVEDQQKENTFQLGLLSDGTNTYAVLIYSEIKFGLIPGCSFPVVGYTTSDTSGSISFIDNAHVVALTSQSNIDVPGVFVFNLQEDAGDLSGSPLLPYGVMEDLTIESLDDADTDPISLQTSFNYFGMTFGAIYINPNGYVSFAPTGVPSHCPLAESWPNMGVIAPLLQDHTLTMGDGVIHYRVVTMDTDSTLVEGVTSRICGEDNDCDFQASWLFIVTWADVTYSSSSDTTQTDTFQLVLAQNSEATSSYAIFLYEKLGYDDYTWTDGDDDCHTKVGYVSIDGQQEYLHDTTTAGSVQDLVTTTNAGLPGMFVFQLSSDTEPEPVEAELFAYGEGTTDMMMMRTDNGYQWIDLVADYPVGGPIYGDAYISVNGYVTFGMASYEWCPDEGWPRDATVAPFFIDIDLGENSNAAILYRQADMYLESTLFTQADAYVCEYLRREGMESGEEADMDAEPNGDADDDENGDTDGDANGDAYTMEDCTFQSTSAFVVTWVNVTAFDVDSDFASSSVTIDDDGVVFIEDDTDDPVNTFQVAVVTNGLESYAITLYDHMEWFELGTTTCNEPKIGVYHQQEEEGYDGSVGYIKYNSNIDILGAYVWSLGHAEWCLENPCQHDGLCVDNGSGYTCECVGDWTGDNCQTFAYLDPCVDSPCGEGECSSDAPYTYSCTCPGGTTGFSCPTGTCKQITFNMCQNLLPYGSTAPDTDESDVQSTIATYLANAPAACLEIAALFLCAYHYPRCVDGVTTQVCLSNCDVFLLHCGVDLIPSIQCTELPDDPTGETCTDIMVTTAPLPAEGSVRLVNNLADDPWSGRLELMHENSWYTVCNEGLTVGAATLACRDLAGDPPASMVGTAVMSGVYSEGTAGIFPYRAYCREDDHHFVDCFWRDDEYDSMMTMLNPEEAASMNCSQAAIQCSVFEAAEWGCDMSEDICSFSLESSSTYIFSWAVSAGDASTINIPDADANGDVAGRFVVMVLGDADPEQQTAAPFISPGLVVGEEGACVRFSYFLLGENISLALNRYDGYNLQDMHQLWLGLGDMGDVWHSAEVTLDMGEYQLAFTADCGNPESAMAFDDIALTSGETCGNVRLVGGQKPTVGRVEYFYQGRWTPVCVDDFDVEDASVVCRELGLTEGLAYIVDEDTWSDGENEYDSFGQAPGPARLSNLGCTCRDWTLQQCGQADGGDLDFHSQDEECRHVGVSCNHEWIDGFRMEVALSGEGSTEYSGRLNVTLYDVDELLSTGTVCNYNFEEVDAFVACKHLHEDTIYAYVTDEYGAGDGDIALTDVACSCDARNLDDCNFDHEPEDCTHEMDVGITCIVSSQFSFSIVGGENGEDGRAGIVEISMNGETGYICDDYWDDDDATVLCNMMEHTGEARAVGGGWFGETDASYPIFLDDVDCDPRMEHIAFCGHRPFGEHNCRHWEAAAVVCNAAEDDFPFGLEVRLSGGGVDSVQGLVEVSMDGSEWGYICHDQFDDRDAATICAMHGMDGAYGQSYGYSFFDGEVNDGMSYFLDELDCYAGAKSLVQCSHLGWGEHNCLEGHVASVVCREYSHEYVRLVGGEEPSEGQVQVKHEGKWGSICSKGWDTRDASVVCRQLGFEHGHAVPTYWSEYHQETGYTWLSDVSCTGLEESIFDCPWRGWGIYTCDHSMDAGVKCYGEWQPLELRLADGSTEYEGRVEIRYEGVWGTVCGLFFNEPDATTVCRMLFEDEYPDVIGTPLTIGFFGPGAEDSPVWLGDVQCAPMAHNITDCAFAGWGAQDFLTIGKYTECEHSVDAAITCKGSVSTEFRLVDGMSSNQGLVQVRYQDKWGYVCSELRDENTATAICTQMGYIEGGTMMEMDSDEDEDDENDDVDIFIHEMACPDDPVGVGGCPFVFDPEGDCKPEYIIHIRCEGLRMGASSEHGECEQHPREMAFCESAPWTMTFLPRPQQEQLYQHIMLSPGFREAFTSECYRYAAEYMCDHAVGPCTDDNRLLKPCRSFCEAFTPCLNLLPDFYRGQFSNCAILPTEDCMLPDHWRYQPPSQLDMPCPEYSCDDGRTCFRGDWKCDGIPDCRDGKDEENCMSAGLQEGVPCTFEDGMCGIMQDQLTDDLDWMIGSGPTPSAGTGPRTDASGHADGSYLYLDSLTCRHSGQEARLLSPVLTIQPSACLSYSYHMYGANGGSLKVYIIDPNTHVLYWEMTHEGDLGDTWHVQTVNNELEGVLQMQTIFVAVCGQGPQADIAIDNIQATMSSCLPPDHRISLADPYGQGNGRVQISFEYGGNGEAEVVGTVCDDRGSWSSREALVICRNWFSQYGIQQQLTGAMVLRVTQPPASMNSPILLSGVDCRGDELRLEHCEHDPIGQVADDCTHEHDVSVGCFTDKTTVRLVMGMKPGEGFLQIFHYIAGFVSLCADYFDESAARATCHSFGYQDVTHAWHRAQPLPPDADVTLVKMKIECPSGMEDEGDYRQMSLEECYINYSVLDEDRRYHGHACSTGAAYLVCETAPEEEEEEEDDQDGDTPMSELLLSCSFDMMEEDEMDEGFCGSFTQDTEDGWNWGVAKPHPPSPDYALFMKTTPPVMPGETARLFTSEFEGTGSDCLRFRYLISKPEVGTLEIRDATDAVLATYTGEEGSYWRFANVASTASGATQLVFHGIAGDDMRHDIFVDDVTITPGDSCDGVCVAGDYECEDVAKCIPEHWVCNNHHDCPNLDDEQDCPIPDDADLMACDDGIRLPSSYFCDHMHIHCADNSDELNCEAPTEDGFVPCETGDQYVYESFLCDGWYSCVDHSDEKDCNCTELECDIEYGLGKIGYGGCYSYSQRCDFKADCLDASDEMGCCITCTFDDGLCMTEIHSEGAFRLKHHRYGGYLYADTSALGLSTYAKTPVEEIPSEGYCLSFVYWAVGGYLDVYMEYRRRPEEMFHPPVRNYSPIEKKKVWSSESVLEETFYSGMLPLPAGSVRFYFHAYKHSAYGVPGQVGLDHVLISPCPMSEQPPPPCPPMPPPSSSQEDTDGENGEDTDEENGEDMDEENGEDTDEENGEDMDEENGEDMDEENGEDMDEENGEAMDGHISSEEMEDDDNMEDNDDMEGDSMQGGDSNPQCQPPPPPPGGCNFDNGVTCPDFTFQGMYLADPSTSEETGCHFPFMYNGYEYNHCTEEGWCSSTPDAADGHIMMCNNYIQAEKSGSYIRYMGPAHEGRCIMFDYKLRQSPDSPLATGDSRILASTVYPHRSTIMRPMKVFSHPVNQWHKGMFNVMPGSQSTMLVSLITNKYGVSIDDLEVKDGFCPGCAENCTACHSPEDCIQCEPGYRIEFDETWNAICTPCDTTENCVYCPRWLPEDGLEPSGGDCMKCEEGFYLDTTKQCAACEGAFPNCRKCWVSNEDGECEECMHGYYMDDNTQTCASCDDGCEYCEGPGECKKCMPNYFSMNNEEESTLTCHHCESENCKKCTLAGCLLCDIGYFPAPDGKCIHCSGSFTNCVSCRDREDDGNIGVGECLACIEGDISEDGSQCLEGCPGDCAFCYDNMCHLCKPGYYLDPNAEMQETRPSAYLPMPPPPNPCLPCDISNCLACTETGCTECAQEFYVNDQMECEACSDANCARCSADGCYKCKPGYLVDDAMACQACTTSMCAMCTPEDACMKCEPGYGLAMDAGTLTCSECDVENCQECDSWDAERQVEMEGMAACQHCMPGYFYNVLTQQCSDCPDGCALCSDDNEDGNIVQMWECWRCEDGYSENYEGSCEMSCPGCRESHCRPDGTCDSCEYNYRLTSELTCEACRTPFCSSCPNEVCILCISGYWLDPDKECKSCDESLRGCSFCRVMDENEDENENDNVECLACAGGTIQTGDDGNDVCMAECNVHHCRACAADGTCEGCVEGFYVNTMGHCQPCESRNCRECVGQDQHDGYDYSPSVCTSCWTGQPRDTGCPFNCTDNCHVCIGGVCWRCLLGYAFDDAGECVECEDEYCLHCSAPGQCKICQYGYSAAESGECLPCGDVISNCARCNEIGPMDAPPAGDICNECEQGHYVALDRASCSACDVDYCESCYGGQEEADEMVAAGQCTVCLSGFYLAADKECKTCGADYTDCQRCEDDSGDGMISRGECHECPEGMVMGSNRCDAPFHCWMVSEYIAVHDTCDGVPNCVDGSDEWLLCETMENTAEFYVDFDEVTGDFTAPDPATPNVYTWQVRRGRVPGMPGMGYEYCFLDESHEPLNTVMIDFVNSQYLYADASLGMEGDEATLSFDVSETSEGKCLTFGWFLSIEGASSLKVMAGDEKIWELGNFSPCYENPPKWYRSVLDIPGSLTYDKIHFVAVHGPGSRGNVAVDHISVKNGACTAVVVCLDDEFMCVEENRCIRRSVVCDDHADCEDGSDEESALCDDMMTDDESSMARSSHGGGHEEEEEEHECPYYDEECEDDYHRCALTGKCLPEGQVCDGEYHCGLEDQSDELCRECLWQIEHKCSRTGVCISKMKICDGRDDCGDLEDETFMDCDCDEELQYECFGGGCIDKVLRCNGVEDCHDGSDEIFCEEVYSETMYSCNLTGEYIPHLFVCDGKPDCLFGYDERVCEESDCPPDHFWCGGQCFHESAWCDGKSHCLMREDEMDCEENRCAPNQHRCNDGTCVGGYDYCDGKKNCPDGTDEPPGCLCAPKWQFRCVMTDKCVPYFKVGDGRNDCSDWSDERDNDCTADQFRCEPSGVCLPMITFCNKIVDCPDESDELVGCSANCDLEEYFVCDDRCVHKKHLCDQNLNCLDGMDEMDCPLLPYQRVCESGQVVDSLEVCDGHPDCWDFSDEAHCKCADDEWPCATGGCIKRTALCNRNNDCMDGSDEAACYMCSNGEFTCDGGGRCLQQEWVCDGLADCDDATDEAECDRCSAAPDVEVFTCRNHECVLAGQRCDGNNDCNDGSDEFNCTQATMTTSGSAAVWVIEAYSLDQQAFLPICSDNWSDEMNGMGCTMAAAGRAEMSSPVSLDDAGSPDELFTISPDREGSLLERLVPIPRSECESDMAAAVVCGQIGCGQKSPDLNLAATYILGGELAQAGQWPWMVYLDMNQQQFCGAAIIDEHWILTAAHCLTWITADNLMFAQAVAGSVKFPAEGADVQRFYFDKIFVHEHYNPAKIMNDVALIRTRDPIQFNDYVQPICLPAPGEDADDVSIACYASGWGVHSTTVFQAPLDLKQLKINIWSPERCENDPLVLTSGYDPELNICTGYEVIGTTPCFGDSGGPLSCVNRQGHWTLQGVVSFGDEECNKPPAAFARVSAYTDWIYDIIDEYERIHAQEEAD